MPNNFVLMSADDIAVTVYNASLLERQLRFMVKRFLVIYTLVHS